MPDFGETLVEDSMVPSLGFIDTDDDKWRSITRTREDLPVATFERTCKIARFLFMTNPIARRIIELTVSFTLGSGISFEARDKRVYKTILDFWEDPVNSMDRKLANKVRDLSLYGEQVFPIFANPRDGRIRLGYINPIDVQRVMVDPANPEIVRKLLVSSATSVGQPLEISIVNIDEDPSSPTFGYLVGQALYFAINKSPDATRGVSDLLPLIDWISTYDTLLFNALERSAHMNAYLWDVTMEDADQTTVDNFLKNIQSQPPKPGAIRVHNQKVIWRAVTPELQAGDVTAIARLFKLHILGGAGMPEHFFGEGGEGRAAVTEMSEVAMRTLSTRQKLIKSIVEFIFQFVIDQAIIHGALPADIDRTFFVYMPRISTREVWRTATSVPRLVEAFSLAEDRGWITKTQAKRLFMSVTDMLGIGEEIRKEELVDEENQDNQTSSAKLRTIGATEPII